MHYLGVASARVERNDGQGGSIVGYVQHMKGPYKIHKSLNAFPLLQTPPHQNYHLKVVDMKMYQVCHSALN